MSAEAAGQYINHHLTNWDVSLKTFSSHGDGFWTVHLDTLIVSWALGLIFFFLFFLAARRAHAGVPGKFQNFIEACIEWIDGVSKEYFTQTSPLVAPLALTIFMWVFLMNFMDLVPVDLLPSILSWFGVTDFRSVPTSDPYTTFALAIGVFILLIIYNLRFKGFFGVIKEILVEPFGVWMLPLNVFFHLMEAFVKPFSLSLRLFGNLFAGEMIFILIAALVPWPLQWLVGVPWSLLHGLIITIQAFVFMLLTVVYLNMAANTHSH